MKALFKELPAFSRFRADYLTDEDFRGLQNLLMENPLAGEVIEGAGGLRKVRYADARRGKGTRGGLRVIYFWWETGQQFWRSPCMTRMKRRICRCGNERRSRSGSSVNWRPEMAKRNLLIEMTEGFEALAEEHAGKINLRTYLEVCPTKNSPKNH